MAGAAKMFEMVGKREGKETEVEWRVTKLWAGRAAEHGQGRNIFLGDVEANARGDGSRRVDGSDSGTGGVGVGGRGRAWLHCIHDGHLLDMSAANASVVQ